MPGSRDPDSPNASPVVRFLLIAIGFGISHPQSGTSAQHSRSVHRPLAPFVLRTTPFPHMGQRRSVCPQGTAPAMSVYLKLVQPAKPSPSCLPVRATRRPLCPIDAHLGQ